MKKSVMQRSTIEFTPETVAVLDHLKQRLGKRSNAEIVRLALQVLNYFEKQREQGYTVGVVLRKEGDSGIQSIREVELIA
jgi:hypothetical protein